MQFHRDTEIKAVRKERKCYGCGKPINVGEPAVYSVGFWDDFYTSYRHPVCGKITGIIWNDQMMRPDAGFEQGDLWEYAQAEGATTMDELLEKLKTTTNKLMVE